MGAKRTAVRSTPERARPPATQAHPGDHLVGAAGQPPQHGDRVLRRSPGLPEHAALARRPRCRRPAPAGSPGAATAAALARARPLDPAPPVLPRQQRLVRLRHDDPEGDAELAQDAGPARRGRGEDEPGLQVASAPPEQGDHAGHEGGRRRCASARARRRRGRCGPPSGSRRGHARVEDDRDVHPLHGGLDHVDHVLARHVARHVQLEHDDVGLLGRDRLERRRCRRRPRAPAPRPAPSRPPPPRACAASSSIRSTRLAPARSAAGRGPGEASRPPALAAIVRGRAGRPGGAARICSWVVRAPPASRRAPGSRRSAPEPAAGSSSRRRGRRAAAGCWAPSASSGRGILLSGVPGGNVADGVGAASRPGFAGDGAGPALPRPAAPRWTAS